VLIASAIIILVGTSAPIFGQSVDTFFYNEMHLPLAIIIMFLNGLSLLIKWRKTDTSELIKKSTYSVLGAILFTLILIIFVGISDLMIILLALTTAFSLFVNLDIAIKIVKGNFKMLGAYVAHIGIALFILGVIGSAVYSEEVTIDLVKDKPASAFGYEVTFTEIYPIANNTKYAFNVNVKKDDTEYKVAPIMYRSDFNNSIVREPAILTLLTKDIYFSPLSYDEGSEIHSAGQKMSVNLGSEIEFEGTSIKYLEFIKPDMNAMMSGGDIEMGAKLSVTKDGKSYEVSPMIKGQSGQFVYVPVEVKEANLKIEIHKIEQGSYQAEFTFSNINGDSQTISKPQEVLSVTASIKPFVNLVWAGVVIMVVGFFISMTRRLKESMVIS
jgi:cytochrome c-type biogenesis protein CcmF